MGYELKVNDGKVTFLMRTGKDKVKSQMLLSKAHRLLNTAKGVTPVEGDFPICADDTYFFEGSWEIEAPVEEVKKKKKPYLVIRRKERDNEDILFRLC